MDKDFAIGSLPQQPTLDVEAFYEKALGLGEHWVVLDDDPTGTQTVHDVPVLTRWDVESLRQEFHRGSRAFYILTNSRALPEADAMRLAKEIGENLSEASGDLSVSVVSRGDSTLRGHFPTEVDSLVAGLSRKVDGTILAPAFIEGGRLTIDTIHYVDQGDSLSPVAETEFARDSTFSFKSSELAKWVEEKSRGRIAASEVVCIKLSDIREGGSDRVRQILLDCADDRVIAVDAVSYEDLMIVASGVFDTLRAGKNWVYRTAASLARVLAGIPSKPLLAFGELRNASAGLGGVTVVGSYVQKTTEQLRKALALPGVVGLEVPVAELLDAESRAKTEQHFSRELNQAISSGKHAMLYTGRDLVKAGDLSVGKIVSSALAQIVRGLKERPSYFIAKGGITSSDMATEALGVTRAMVKGQILPGVPVWELGAESHFPGMRFVVFPGNVGDANALADIVGGLISSASE